MVTEEMKVPYWNDKNEVNRNKAKKTSLGEEKSGK